MDESDISKWENNIERWMSADYDILNETVEGKQYSDDELREKFRNGLKKLEDNDDFDVVISNVDGHFGEERRMVVWKALKRAGVGIDDLTGNQMLNLYDIIGYDPMKEYKNENQESK